MRTQKLLLLASLALAGLPFAGRAQTKIAVVNYGRAIDETDEGKALGASFKKEMEERQKKLDSKQDEFEKAKADFDKQVAVMTDAAKKEKADDLQKRYVELNQLAESMSREMSAKKDEVLAPMTARVNQVVKEVADAEGIGLVIRAEVVVYGAPSLDITNEVIRKYNVKFPRKPGAPADAAKPAGDKATTKPAADKPPPKTK